MTSDFQVTMSDDSATEFVVKFHGPKESESEIDSLLIIFQVLMKGEHGM